MSGWAVLGIWSLSQILIMGILWFDMRQSEKRTKKLKGSHMPDREAIRAKFGGRCAYCGKLLGEKWHADHVDSKRRGGDPEGQLYPACPRCNLHKGVWTIEEWRGEIAAQVKRLRRDSAAFRLAEGYGLIKETGAAVVFYFERSNEGKGER